MRVAQGFNAPIRIFNDRNILPSRAPSHECNRVASSGQNRSHQIETEEQQFMGKRINNVEDVAAWRLCLGCGVCIPACRQGALTLIDVESEGLRPITNGSRCRKCGECIEVCPGIRIEKDSDTDPQSRVPSQMEFPKANRGSKPKIAEFESTWGPILEIWEGYAQDTEIRFCGSSGGVATALALFCLMNQKMSGVLHIGPDADNPMANSPALSSTRADLLMRTGSRYAPAAPCLGLPLLDERSAPYVFLGKPCDVVAIRKWQHLRRSDPDSPELRTFGVLISIFCAGTPSTRATKEILDKWSVKPSEVVDLRYRGRGWPGETVVRTRQSGATGGSEFSMSYENSWGGILHKHTQFRCRLCPDSTGELADISCGDPWYRGIESGDPGRSLVLVRTETGRMILQEAMKAGFVRLERVADETLPRSQRSLLQKRRNLWGRLLALRMLGIPVPVYQGFHLFRNWFSLSTVEKLRSILGTMHRVLIRKTIKRKRSQAMGSNTK